MSHYYLASPAQLQEALVEHCERWDEQQAHIFKKLLQDFLDSPAAIKHRLRIDVPDLTLPRVGIAGDVAPSAPPAGQEKP
jgi:hypothetical protein